MWVRKMIRSRFSVIICMVLFLVTSVGNLPAVYAAGEQSNTATKGVYYFDPHEVGKDVTDIDIDDNHEYLRIYMKDGETATFRNSYAILFNL